MRSLFLLASAGLFLVGDRVVSASASVAETMKSAPTIEEAPTIDEIDNFNQLHYVDIDIQSRRKEWDVFNVLLMMIHNDCGIHGEVHLPDCRLLRDCRDGLSINACGDLCDMQHERGKSKYAKFCDMDSSSSSSSNAAESNTADPYNGSSSSPDSFGSDGAWSAQYSIWMVAIAASVGMALVAIRIGQRRNIVVEEDGSLMGVEVRGSVGRRTMVVSGLMDGVLGTRTKHDNSDNSNSNSQNSQHQVEMAEYQLEGARTSSYESAIV